MTWDDHEHAEYTEYMQALLGGQCNVQGYVDMVAQHYYAYLVIEEAAEKMRDDAVGGPFVYDSLARIPALEADLQFLLGDDWRTQIAPNEATKEYCARLKEVCFDWPGGFVAHAYTRYLGDLSGGQVIKGAVERAFQFKDQQGVQFYVFDQIPDYKAFKIQYRDQARRRALGRGGAAEGDRRGGPRLPPEHQGARRDRTRPAALPQEVTCR